MTSFSVIVVVYAPSFVQSLSTKYSSVLIGCSRVTNLCIAGEVVVRRRVVMITCK